MITPHTSEEAILSEHFYNSLEDPTSTARGLVLVPLFVVGFLLPFAAVDSLVLLFTILFLLLALVSFAFSWLVRRLQLREALRLLVWLRSVPFQLDGYLDALNYEPLRDRYFYIRAELEPMQEDKLPAPAALNAFIDERLQKVRIRFQLGENLTILLTSTRLSTLGDGESGQRSNLDCHRWLRICLQDVLLPLHEKYPIRRVLIYHQNA